MRIIHTYDCDDVNGEGLRTVIFISGCKWQCPGCFNPQTHSFEAGEPFTAEKEREVFDKVDHPWIDGLTCSGGDPLFQGQDFIDFLKRFRDRFGHTKTIWVYTGFETEAILADKVLKQVFKYADVLCTGKFIASRTKPKKQWVGSNNQSVIRCADYANYL